MTIRPVTEDDRASWERLRTALWPSERATHAGEIDRFFAGTLGEPVAVLLACDERGEAVGLIELSIRAHAEGCTSDRVAYVEGWYVVPSARRRRVGAALMQAAEAWARDQGCTELGSDTEVQNVGGATAHRAVGFTEAAVIRCFKKTLR